MFKVRQDQKDALSQAGVGRVQTCPARPGELETRRITVAQGIQFNNADMADHPYAQVPYGLTTKLEDRHAFWPDTKFRWWPPSMLKRPPLKVHYIKDGFEYTSTAQGVKYVVDIVNTKWEFKNALNAVDRHVIYAGHARYGRGPCFGDKPGPGENWEDGDDPPWGLFRMGYPFIGIDVEDILHHKYTADLTPSSVSIPVDQVEKALRPRLPGMQAKTAADIHPDLLQFLKDKDPGQTWWTYVEFDDLDDHEEHTGKFKPHPCVVINAGWKDTTVTPDDLGAVTPSCRVFCHFACDTFNHNHLIWRDTAFKGWQRNGDDRFAYWTSAVSRGDTANHWLYHLLTYPVYNAFCAWEPSLNYAVAKTNADLKMDNASYRII